jgi:putative oxidoreductase
MARLKTVGLWILQLLLAILMIGPGAQKFTSPMWQRMFRAWGYPEDFYLVIGAIEVVAGVGLLIPRAAAPSALLLMLVMIGAAMTQMTRGGRNGVGELVLAALLALIAYARRPARLRNRRAAAQETIGVR